MEYQYWTIRFVPDVARGEFTNIGLVCGRDDGDWSVRFDTRHVKSHRTLVGDADQLSPWIDDFTRSITGYGAPALTEGSPRVSGDWVNHVRTRQANSVQFSSQASVDAESAQAAIDILFPHLVQRTTATRRSVITRRNLRAAVRDTLVMEMNFSVGIDLFMKPETTVGKQRGSFDLARFAPDAEVLTNVWAFNVVDVDALEREIQSWNFLVGLLRQDGASIKLKNGTSRFIDAATPIEVVHHVPQIRQDDAWRSDTYAAACEAWARNDVSFRSLDQYQADAEKKNLATIN